MLSLVPASVEMGGDSSKNVKSCLLGLVLVLSVLRGFLRCCWLL